MLGECDWLGPAAERGWNSRIIAHGLGLGHQVAAVTVHVAAQGRPGGAVVGAVFQVGDQIGGGVHQVAGLKVQDHARLEFDGPGRNDRRG